MATRVVKLALLTDIFVYQQAPAREWLRGELADAPLKNAFGDRVWGLAGESHHDQMQPGRRPHFLGMEWEQERRPRRRQESGSYFRINHIAVTKFAEILSGRPK